MARFRYVCSECGNMVPAERIEKRVPGTKGHVRLMPVSPVCEKDNSEMRREEYTPPRREIGEDRRY